MLVSLLRLCAVSSANKDTAMGQLEQLLTRALVESRKNKAHPGGRIMMRRSDMVDNRGGREGVQTLESLSRLDDTATHTCSRSYNTCVGDGADDSEGREFDCLPLDP